MNNVNNVDDVMSEDAIKKEKKKLNPWMISTLVLAVLAIAMFGINITGLATGNLSPEQCSGRVKTYIENILPGADVDISDVKEDNGLYKMDIEITMQGQSQKIVSYATMDGKLLFPSAIDLEKVPEPSQPSEFDAPDREKPTIELFVMSFCPYGVQAENAMKPVVDLFGDKIDVRVRFIANAGDTINSSQSLHGINEVMEDLRQLCVMKYYPDKYWDYLMEINNNCYSLYRDSAALDRCWKDAANKFGIDIAKIESSLATDGLALLKEDKTIADGYGVSGSPTLIINGEEYYGTRSSEAFKSAICSGFTSPPSECSEALSNSSSAPSGGCE